MNGNLSIILQMLQWRIQISILTAAFSADLAFVIKNIKKINTKHYTFSKNFDCRTCGLCGCLDPPVCCDLA